MANLQTTTVTGFTNVCQATASPAGPVGRLWYDNSSCTLKYSWCGNVAAWSSHGLGDRVISAGGGTQNAGIATCGGTFSVGTGEYNGNSWSSGGTRIYCSYKGGGANAGTQNSFLAFGGIPFYATEEYNGNTWSSGGGGLINVYEMGFAGTQNAALSMGGNGEYCYTQEYNGNSWARTTNSINQFRAAGGSGTQNAGLTFGGYNSPFKATNEYNGNTWATGGNVPWPANDVTISPGGMAIETRGTGTQNDTLAVGGYIPSFSPFAELACAYKYNGNTWSLTTSLPVGRQGTALGGTSTCAFAGMGQSTPNNCTTYNYSESTGFQVCELT